MKIWILFAILIISCFSCFAQNSPAPNSNRPPTVDELRVTTIKGLGDRATLIKYVSSADSDFVFKRLDDVDGKPDYYASDRYSTSVDMVGQDDEVVMIKWTFNFVADNNADVKELDRMSYFATIMGEPNGAEWFANFYKKFISSPREPYTETKEFPRMNWKGVFNYSPTKRCISLTMTYEGK